jgi:kynurenine formamidase
VIVEGLDLRGVREGAYDLIVMPLRLVDGDGGPARAALRER